MSDYKNNYIYDNSAAEGKYATSFHKSLENCVRIY